MTNQIDPVTRPQNELLADLPETPSRAVVANNTRNGGCVLWFTADSVIEAEISNTSTRLADLGLDDAPEGISIWEGVYIKYVRQDDYLEPSGAFRPPTDEEWTAIRAGRNPFFTRDVQ